MWCFSFTNKIEKQRKIIIKKIVYMKVFIQANIVFDIDRNDYFRRFYMCKQETKIMRLDIWLIQQ